MKLFHHVILSVFVKEGDDKDVICEKMLDVVSLDFDKEKLRIEEEVLDAREGKGYAEISILRVVLSKDRLIRAFNEGFFPKLGKEKVELLLEQLDSRVDDECNFFLRLDKKKMLSGKYELTDSGNCFHFKFVVAAYPANKENAMKIMDGFLRKWL